MHDCLCDDVYKPLRSSVGVKTQREWANCCIQQGNWSFCLSVSLVKLLSFFHLAYMFIP